MPRARVKHELVEWVRVDAGLSVTDVARKTGTSEAIVEAWESGDRSPTLRQLRLLGNAAKRPLAVFFLPEPPRRFQAMHDFRRMPGDPMAEGSPELRLAIRVAQARREIALDLLPGLDVQPPPLVLNASVTDDVRDLAASVRKLLGVSLEMQRKWTGAYDGLNGWKAAVESVGVLVFQATGVEVTEMRGFSLAEDPLPAVVLNVRDAPNGRVFTLLHEFCHLVLRRGGMCDLSESGARPPEDDRVEVFCNAMAAETLVPIAALLLSPVVQAHGTEAEWTPEEISGLARGFSVSREVILRRLLNSGRTTAAFYRARRRELLEEYAEQQKGRTGFSTPDLKAVSYAGPSFVRMVLDSYYREHITTRDVSEYLGVKLKHLPKIEERVLGSRVMFA
jgi:Zn-dependent peptidase ImmA (M78 family)